MAEALKEFFSVELVRRLAVQIAAAYPPFPRDAFVARACQGLAELELLDRARSIASALRAHLPPSYPEALAVLVRSFGPEHDSDELVGAGMAPFFYMPHALVIAEHGLSHFDLSLQAQYELTKRFTAESSIRPYIAHDPERTFETLRVWARDPNPHVRRLVSEGTRLRLPWAQRVRWLDEHPETVLELVELLKDDPASLVRRSVANNLNDLGKVHPKLLQRVCKAWLSSATPQRRATVEHALRSAVKRAEPGALRLLGYGNAAAVEVQAVKVQPRRVPIGEKVEVAFALRSKSKRAQNLLVDLRVHFVKASGAPRPKVFKLQRVTLAAGQRIELQARVSLAVHTTRVPRPGKHVVEALVNGSPLPLGDFEVIAPATKRLTRGTKSNRSG